MQKKKKKSVTNHHLTNQIANVRQFKTVLYPGEYSTNIWV